MRVGWLVWEGVGVDRRTRQRALTNDMITCWPVAKVESDFAFPEFRRAVLPAIGTSNGGETSDDRDVCSSYAARQRLLAGDFKELVVGCAMRVAIYVNLNGSYLAAHRR